MNKSDFVKTIKEVGGYSEKKEAEKALDSVVASIHKVLKENESVELVGFGKFENALQKGKEGIIPGSNPKKKYKTEDKYVPKFKPGKSLKDEVAKIKVKKK
ncbi:HU family DNA-binding protein [Helicobacter saguini]|uniref:HU family DNA-binding protein n=1 Tax=Helicobacter saguini TaxID=1548018 RepID=A0A347VMX0_9HELI|nr:HU family DNA-binding protein [Helicobacter saguini]MWV61992.1 HU family DNA-binding protein [Helicobacter saguini]MWV67334.1 HU family DNA-binding protein [Helicobacter saguini]MWV69685.1 HU family DNA-binding protein [Helicobacter saguini]MWV73097.1 HU family DNA-binding protein [Helicobacter saguini]TLD95535.1 HU family DNA-binding protein [Helicobacter saguini]